MTPENDLTNAEVRRLDQKIEHVKESSTLRADYTRQLAESESKRMDAILADVRGVELAIERQTSAATILASELAKQVAQSADALRTLVSTTAVTTAEQQRQQLTQITDRLALVEKSQDRGRGKELVSDPMLTTLMAELKAMRDVQASGVGKGEGSKAMWGYIVAAVSFLGMLITIGIALLKFVK